MSVPDVKQTIRDGALGIIPGLASGTCLKVGTCSAGTANTIYSFSDPQIALTTLGQGPLTEAVVRSLGVAGGPCLAIPATQTTAGAAGSVTKVGSGSCVVSVTGAPYDAYLVKLTIVASGTNPAAGTATFTYSLDNGTTTSPVIAVPAGGSYPIPNSGLTLAFSAASLVATDTYTFTCTAPSFSLTDLNTAIDVALASSYSYGFIHVVGPASSAANAAAMLASEDTKMATAATSRRYIWTLIEVPSDTDANLIAAFASSASTRVMAVAGFASVVSAVNGRQLSRSAGWVVAERIASIRPGTDPGRVKDGSLPGVISITRDERATPGLDDARFTTLRTILGKNGFYINNGKMMASLGSDFTYVQNRRVMDVFSTVCYQALLDFLNDSVRVDSVTGYINEGDAIAIESFVGTAAKSALVFPGDASDISITVNRASNIISTGILPVTGRVVPLGYNKEIDADLGFSNPALKLSAA